MTISYIKGDLFTSTSLALAHGVNCIGAMGSGIAVEFRERYPDMYLSYRTLCKNKKLKLGMVYLYKDQNSGRYIFNLATQDQPGANAELWAVVATMTKAVNKCKELGLPEIALPKIASGIGGLDFLTQVKPELEKIADQIPTVNLIVYEL